MDKFILSCQRKARKTKTIIELQQICFQLWNAGHHDEANKLLQRCLVKNFGAPKPKPKQPGKVGRKGGLPQPLDYDIIRLRQKGATQRAAGESVELTSDYHVIENRVRDVERRFCEARDGSPKLRREFEAALLLCEDEGAVRKLTNDYFSGVGKRRREYEAALRKQNHTPDLCVTQWGILTRAERDEALNQNFREAIEHFEKLNKQTPL